MVYSPLHVRFGWILVITWCFTSPVFAQVVINEGCNKNYQTGIDEDGDSEDWIELHNAGATAVDLSAYYLSDKASEPFMWPLTGITLEPDAFVQVFCSEKDRYHTDPFQNAVNDINYTPTTGWSTHTFTTPFIWDGVSNIIINVCSYLNTGYTENAVFKQTATPYISTVATFNDGSDASCSALLGTPYFQRPNMQINGITIGDGVIQNTTTDYPAPYGNWYWSARHQMLVRASELLAAGVSPGPLNSLGFEVVYANGITYTYIDISILATPMDELNVSLLPLTGNYDHTNFKISADGENIYLFDAAGTNVSTLFVQSPVADVSVGRTPDDGELIYWMSPTPGATNNDAQVYTDTLLSPILSVPTGIVNTAFSLEITNPNTGPISTKVAYTLDGSEPTAMSPTYTGTPIEINSTTVIRTRVFPISAPNFIPSFDTYGTYLFDVDHTTPILLVTTDNSNLYGPEGIFDNYTSDWIKPAHVTWLTKEDGHPTLFETRTAMRMDGGAGGSRSQPQRSFRLSFAHSALGEKPINEALIPNIPFRDVYSDVYLRNGSNQFLVLPYKDACQVSMMSKGTNTYYSAMEPATVYINGEYFGLYEVREKFNTEYFDVRDTVIEDSVEILTLSYFYNLVLRALEGNVDNFLYDYNAFNALNPLDTNYLTLANQYFDMDHYTDYIIGESWMANIDWPWNNIKIYRSNATGGRWRFALIDLELALAPNSWTTCYYDHIDYMLSQSPDNPYINIWLQCMQNTEYKNYFINRFADLMNTSYLTDTLLAGEQLFYDKMAPEMPNEYARWGDPANIDGQMEQFEANHETFRDQLACRSERVRDDIEKGFDLEKQVKVHLEIYPDSSGTIKINTIQPAQYPWMGTYYDGVPIQLTAVPDSGYTFLHWMPNAFISDTLNPTFKTNVDDFSTTFTAVFERLPEHEGPTIDFRVYPSPATSIITIAHDNPTQAAGTTFHILDMQGRSIATGAITPENTTTINISTLNAALYYIRIHRAGETLETLSFIKL